MKHDKHDKNKEELKLSPNEFRLMAKLDSLYKALMLTAVAPVVLPSESVDEDLRSIMRKERRDGKIGKFSHQYWDTLDHESYASSVMTKRVRYSACDLISHDELHSSFDRRYNLITSAVYEGDGITLYNKVTGLCKDLRLYNTVVSNHIKSNPDPFLHYPACVSGHFFYIPKTGFNPVPSSYNPSQDYRGSSNEVDTIEFLLEKCPPTHLRTKGLRFLDQNSDMLPRNLRTNRLLLERAGFSVGE